MSRPVGKAPSSVPRIALTGGIASGKSTVAQLFMALGAQLIDTDQIARTVVAPGTPALAQITARFGSNVLQADGSLDRRQLRGIVFADAVAKADLEAITHPAIRAEVARQSATPTGPYQLIAIPLLVETGTHKQYDRVLVVDCPVDAQLTRLMLRDGIDRSAAAQMIAAQASREARRSLADDIIENTGNIAALATQVEALHRSYLQLARTETRSV
jgi:dephospho-CoA kinase